jgi:hypothetical protein
MKQKELFRIVGGMPVFPTGLLLSGETTPGRIRAQLSRWVREGKIIRLRRGYYSLAEPYSVSRPSPFVVANAMESGSYVSCQSALAWYGLIPEAVPTVTSITPGRPGMVTNDIGTFLYRHMKPSLLWGFRNEIGIDGWTVRIASPEKALLDLIYLEPGPDLPTFVEQLRLQNTGILQPPVLAELAARWHKPRMTRALAAILALLEAMKE